MILPWSGTYIPDDWPRPAEPYHFKLANVPELLRLFFDDVADRIYSLIALVR